MLKELRRELFVGKVSPAGNVPAFEMAERAIWVYACEHRFIYLVRHICVPAYGRRGPARGPLPAISVAELSMRGSSAVTHLPHGIV